MRPILLVLLPLLALVSFASPAKAETLQGNLEMQWGDPKPVSPGARRPATQFQVNLVDRFGKRYPLDPAQARQAAGDLYMMSGKPVGMEVAPRTSPSAPLKVEAIVPARVSQNTHPVAKSQPMAAGALIGGNTRWVTIACKFSDIAAEQKPISFFTSQYGTAPGQLGHYWDEVSYGKINLAGSQAYGWFTLPSPRITYVPTGQKALLQKLFADCAAAADPTVNFNGLTGINMMFNADLDGYAWGGSSCAPLEGVNTCTRVTWNPVWSFNNLAPLAHEMGHGYGLPHSDNSDGDSDPYDNPWDNLSDAWSNGVGNATYGTLPKHINIFQRDRLGWVDAGRKVTVLPNVTSAITVNLDAASIVGSTNTQMLILQMPTQADPYATTIYTVEARLKTGNYEANLAGDAVIIHRISNTVAYSVDAQVPPATQSSNEGSMFKVGESWTSANDTHQITVVARTATGFTISVGPKGPTRVTGGNAPVRMGTPGAISQGATPSGVKPPAQTSPATRRPAVKPAVRAQMER